MRHTKYKLANKQRGAVLIVSLLLLLVMTILALSMSQTTTLQERMAGNARDVNGAFEGAEAALRAGEAYLQSFTATPATCTTIGDCQTLETAAFSSVDTTPSSDAWWLKAGTRYGTAAKDFDKLAEDPVYVTRRLAKKKDSLGTGYKQTRYAEYWEVSAKSKGITETAEVITQSTYRIDP